MWYITTMVLVLAQSIRLVAATFFPLAVAFVVSVISLPAYGAKPLLAAQQELANDPNAKPPSGGITKAQREGLRAKPPVSHSPRLKEALKRLRDRKGETARATPTASPRATVATSKGKAKVDKRKKAKAKRQDERAKRQDKSKRVRPEPKDAKSARGKGDVRDGLRDAERHKEAPVSPPVARRIVRRPAPPLPPPVYNETELALQQALKLEVVDLGPHERWQVNVINQSLQPLRVATDPRLLTFTARVPGKAQSIACEVPKALQPKGRHIDTEVLSPGETYQFRVDPRMYCFESGDQTILVPGTFLVPAYGWEEATRTRWSWGRRYQERLAQHQPFAGQFVGPQAEPEEQVAQRPGLKRLVGEGFALRSEYQGWAKTRLPEHELGDAPRAGLKLSISHGSDAAHARDVAVTVRLENRSAETHRVYFRRDLVSFIVDGPDGQTECDATAAEWRAPDPQAFTTLRPGAVESFTTRLLEFCPAQSFQRPGFYYVRAVLPGTAPAPHGQEDVFTRELAATAPRPIRLHEAELPYVLRRGHATDAAGRPRADSGGVIPPPPSPPPPPPPAVPVAPPPPVQ